jgi:anti-anti-sigma factor
MAARSPGRSATATTARPDHFRDSAAGAGKTRTLRKMRCQGLVDSPGEVGPNGHACWTFEDLAGDFAAAATAFLNEGIELGQRLMFVGGSRAEEFVRSAEPMSSMVADGSLRVVPFDAVYPGGHRLANADQWSTYAGALEQARREGFTGLRVLAEVTSLASSEDAWPGQALWASYADRQMVHSSLAALCCFDRSAIPAAGLAAIGSAHPVVDRRLEDLVGFRLFGRPGGLALAGEVDRFSSSTLRHLLRAGDSDGNSSSESASAHHVLDLSRLTFIEHTGLRVLHDYAEALRAQGIRLRVRGGRPSVHRLSELLDLPL